MVDGGEDVLGADGALGDGAGDAVGAPDDAAAGDAAAGQRDAVDLRPVVAAAPGHFLDLRGAAVLAEADHQRLVEEASLVEILEQAGKCVVESGEQLVLHAGEVIPVGVPTGAGQAVFIPEDADKAAAGLDQAAGGES